MLAHFAGTIARHEASYPYHLCAVDAVVGPRQEIVIVGNDSASETAAMLRLVRRRYLPNAVLALVPPDGPSEQLKKVIPMAADRPAIGDKPTAYVCESYSCKAPTSSLEKLGALLERR
ncbi:MAG: hypothetical protein HYY16_14160 [Planctomycetes bacterium]|nr:hypothetical protein [Planctomycetota bacterium]